MLLCESKHQQQWHRLHLCPECRGAAGCRWQQQRQQQQRRQLTPHDRTFNELFQHFCDNIVGTESSRPSEMPYVPSGTWARAAPDGARHHQHCSVSVLAPAGRQNEHIGLLLTRACALRRLSNRTKARSCRRLHQSGACCQSSPCTDTKVAVRTTSLSSAACGASLLRLLRHSYLS